MSTKRVEQALRVASPLFFTFRRVIFGNGFAAEVNVPRGRAILVEEHDGIWAYGVNPGGVAAGGESLPEAHADFVLRLLSVFVDLANDAKSFAEFKTGAEKFFAGSARQDEWKEAVNAVRAGTVSEKVAGLPKVAAETPEEILITEVVASEDGFKVTLNVPEAPQARLAA
jgi:hypothetical protein